MLHGGVETSWDKCRTDDTFALGASNDEGMFFYEEHLLRVGGSRKPIWKEWHKLMVYRSEGVA